MKYVYCPAEIRSALVAAGVDLKKLTSIENLVNIVSLHDVAFYLYVNLTLSDHPEVMPEEVIHSLPNALFAGKEAADVFLTDHRLGDEITKQLSGLLNEYSLNGNAPAVQVEGKRLVCDLLDENTILFSHRPLEAGEASDNNLESKRDLLDRLIQQLLVFHSFEEVARMPVFRAYLHASKACMA